MRARSTDSPLANASIDQVTFANGRIALAGEPARSVTFARGDAAGGAADRGGGNGGPEPETKEKYAGYTHSADIRRGEGGRGSGRRRGSPRIVNAVAAGKILNPKTARSQILGGVVMGLGMALMEETLMDHSLGRFMNRNIAEYHMPVNADIHDIDVIFVDEQDDKVNPMGVKGAGRDRHRRHRGRHRQRDLSCDRQAHPPVADHHRQGDGGRGNKGYGSGGGVVTSVVDCGLPRRRVPSRRSRLRIPRNPA